GKAGLASEVEYRREDLLRWKPEGKYAAIFMAFFVSHLPEGLLAPFFSTMTEGLAQGGILVVLEGAGPGSYRTRERMAAQGTFHGEDDIEVRTLNDGRRFRIFKR